MRYIKIILFVLSVVFLGSSVAFAQDGDEAYTFLRFPSSVRAGALGGYTVSLIEDDPALVFHNPALLGGEMDGKANLNYINYISGVNIGSAAYTKAFGERSAWAVGATYINYGTMDERTAENVILGTFSVQDIAIQGSYSYDLSEKWRGGLSLKALYSTITDYSSFGLAVDAGLSYFNSEKDLSFGITLKNIGAQLKSYYDERQSIPWDFQMGFTKRLSNAPIRFSVTGMYLNRWKFEYVENATEKTIPDDGFFETAVKHLVFGLEFVPTDNFWIGLGFNPKTRSDMKLTSGNGLGGFSVGAGLKVNRFNIGVSVAKYHPSATSLMLGVSMNFSEVGL